MLKGRKKRVEKAAKLCIYIPQATPKREQKSELKTSLGRFIGRLMRRSGETSKGGELCLFHHFA